MHGQKIDDFVSGLNADEILERIQKSLPSKDHPVYPFTVLYLAVNELMNAEIKTLEHLRDEHLAKFLSTLNIAFVSLFADAFIDKNDSWKPLFQTRVKNQGIQSLMGIAIHIGDDLMMAIQTTAHVMQKKYGIDIFQNREYHRIYRTLRPKLMEVFSLTLEMFPNKSSHVRHFRLFKNFGTLMMRISRAIVWWTAKTSIRHPMLRRPLRAMMQTLTLITLKTLESLGKG